MHSTWRAALFQRLHASGTQHQIAPDRRFEATYKRLKDIVGQEHIVEYLREMLGKDAPGHAYIFCGPRGIGKKTIARAFAAALLCPYGHQGDSCGTCNVCKMFGNMSTPDFYVIDGKNAGIGIDMIRDLRRDMVKRPVYGKRKVYLVCDADNMTVQAQNGILKTLEEPPSYAVVLMTADNYESLLETIRSRAVKLTLHRNKPGEIRQALMNSAGVIPGNVDFILSYSGGIIGKALKLADPGNFKEVRDKLLDIIFALPRASVSEALEYYDFFEENREDTAELLGMMESVYRDLLTVKSGVGMMLINSDKKDIILNNADVLTTRQIIRNISIVEDTAMSLQYNAAHKMAIEAMLIKLQEED